VVGETWTLKTVPTEASAGFLPGPAGVSAGSVPPGGGGGPRVGCPSRAALPPSVPARAAAPALLRASPPARVLAIGWRRSGCLRCDLDAVAGEAREGAARTIRPPMRRAPRGRAVRPLDKARRCVLLVVGHVRPVRVAFTPNMLRHELRDPVRLAAKRRSDLAPVAVQALGDDVDLTLDGHESKLPTVAPYFPPTMPDAPENPCKWMSGLVRGVSRPEIPGIPCVAGDVRGCPPNRTYGGSRIRTCVGRANGFTARLL
jgi:hypothetical protein